MMSDMESLQKAELNYQNLQVRQGWQSRLVFLFLMAIIKDENLFSDIYSCNDKCKSPRITH